MGAGAGSRRDRLLTRASGTRDPVPWQAWSSTLDLMAEQVSITQDALAIPVFADVYEQRQAASHLGEQQTLANQELMAVLEQIREETERLVDSAERARRASNRASVPVAGTRQAPRTPASSARRTPPSPGTLVPAPGDPPAANPAPPAMPATLPRPPARTPATDPAPIPAPETARLETPSRTPIGSPAGTWPLSPFILGLQQLQDTGGQRPVPPDSDRFRP